MQAPATPLQGVRSKVLATTLQGGVAQDAAQDTVMSGGAVDRRNSPREKEDDEERAKRQRMEKKTELEMEVSSGKISMTAEESCLDLRRDGFELENVNHRDAAMFCACELRPRVTLTRCTKRTQLESTWDVCRAQGAQGLGFVCEFVGNIADDPVTKNIQNSTGCNDTIIRESLSTQKYQSS